MSAAMVAAMQEQLKKRKEEEERLEREQAERIRLEDEREEARLEAVRLEAERKEKKKQREAERKARLKAEGKLLTKKQKEDRARAQALLDSLKAQGLEVPDPTEKRPVRLGDFIYFFILLSRKFWLLTLLYSAYNIVNFLVKVNFKISFSS